jgi:hypothetical protein
MFDNVKNAKAAFAAFKKWSKSANDGELTGEEQGDYEIHSLEHQAEFVNFDLSSGRVQNAQWQMERVLNWFKQQPGIKEVEMTLLEVADSLNWTPADSQ